MANGSICGGIIKESEYKMRLEKGLLMGIMLCHVMPDKKYDEYLELKDKGKNKEATKLFDRYAWSMI